MRPVDHAELPTAVPSTEYVFNGNPYGIDGNELALGKPAAERKIGELGWYASTLTNWMCSPTDPRIGAADEGTLPCESTWPKPKSRPYCEPAGAIPNDIAMYWLVFEGVPQGWGVADEAGVGSDEGRLEGEPEGVAVGTGFG